MNVIKSVPNLYWTYQFQNNMFILLENITIEPLEKFLSQYVYSAYHLTCSINVWVLWLGMIGTIKWVKLINSKQMRKNYEILRWWKNTSPNKTVCDIILGQKLT